MPKTIIIKNKKPTLSEAQNLVGGYIEIAYDDGQTQIICNEEGKLFGASVNIEATTLWAQKLGVKLVADMHDVLVGDILILENKARLD